jgi:hypothetical protein
MSGEHHLVNRLNEHLVFDPIFLIKKSSGPTGAGSLSPNINLWSLGAFFEFF